MMSSIDHAMLDRVASMLWTLYTWIAKSGFDEVPHEIYNVYSQGDSSVFR